MQEKFYPIGPQEDFNNQAYPKHPGAVNYYNNDNSAMQADNVPWKNIPNNTTNVVHVVHMNHGVSSTQAWLGQTKSVSTTCISCNLKVSTKVSWRPASKIWLISLILLSPILIGCVPCCCIPFLFPGCYEYKHTWTNCGSYVGTSKTGQM